MVKSTKTSIAVSTLLFGSVALIAAGASVPSEETMALGFFLMLAAVAMLLGLHWPRTRGPRLHPNLVSLSAYRSARRPRA